MRPPVVPRPVLAAFLVLLFAAPVLAAGGSPGGGNSAGGGEPAGTGGQSSVGDEPSFFSVASASGQVASVNRGGGTPDGGSPAKSATDPSTNAQSGTPGSPSMESSPGIAGGPDTGNGNQEPGPAGGSGGNLRAGSLTGMTAGADIDSVGASPWEGTQEQVREGPVVATNGAGMNLPAGNMGSKSQAADTREQTRNGEGPTTGGTRIGPEAGANSHTRHEAGYAPGWSYSGTGTLMDISGLVRDISPGPAGMKGNGQGRENRPVPSPGHVPYGEVPYGHIPYGPNPAATVLSPASSTTEEPRRATRQRNGQQAAMEVTEDERCSPAVFPLAFPPLLPLGYRRIFGKNILAHPSRKQIHDHISLHPGTDLKGIAEACGMNRETVRYHLKQMTAYHKITLLSAGGNIRYFQNHGLFSRMDQMVIHHLEKGTSGEILRYISVHPGSTRQDIAEYLGIAGPTVSRHLATLAREGLLLTKKEGKFLRCYLGTGVILPGFMMQQESPEPGQGTCTGS
jgi:DNA-binding transcriptional ArsR family regulator